MPNVAVVANESLVEIETFFKTNFLDMITLKLFQNDFTPTESVTASDFTECDFPGYAPLNPSSWLTPTIVAGSYAQTQSGIQEFMYSGSGSSQNIYGWWLEFVSGKVYLAARDPSAPIVVANDGDLYRVNIFDVLDQGIYPG